MNTQNQPVESLGYYPSEYITGRSRSTSKIPAAVCLKESAIAEFWREAVRAIDSKSDSDVDGVVYTSDEIGVFLRPWDIDIRHRIESICEQRYDIDFGAFETVHVRDNESFEVVGAHDYENDIELHGLVRVLNDYYKNHENEILKNL